MIRSEHCCQAKYLEFPTSCCYVGYYRLYVPGCTYVHVCHPSHFRILLMLPSHKIKVNSSNTINNKTAKVINSNATNKASNHPIIQYADQSVFQPLYHGLPCKPSTRWCRRHQEQLAWDRHPNFKVYFSPQEREPGMETEQAPDAHEVPEGPSTESWYGQ